MESGVKGPDERHKTAPLTPLPTPPPHFALDNANVVRDVNSGMVFSQATFHFQQKRGPYPVGLSIVYQYDRTRPDLASSKKLPASSPDESARPLQTLIWFPSESTPEKPMTVGDYAHLSDSETH